MGDGLHLSGKGGAAVDSGMGNIKNIFGSKHCLNTGGLLRDASSRTRGH